MRPEAYRLAVVAYDVNSEILGWEVSKDLRSCEYVDGVVQRYSLS
jgi:hypothetical protein